MSVYPWFPGCFSLHFPGSLQGLMIVSYFWVAKHLCKQTVSFRDRLKSSTSSVKGNSLQRGALILKNLFIQKWQVLMTKKKNYFLCIFVTFSTFQFETPFTCQYFFLVNHDNRIQHFGKSYFQQTVGFLLRGEGVYEKWSLVSFCWWRWTFETATYGPLWLWMLKLSPFSGSYVFFEEQWRFNHLGLKGFFTCKR